MSCFDLNDVWRKKDKWWILWANIIKVIQDLVNIYKSDILEDRKKTTIDRIIHLREGFEHLIPLIEVKFQRKI